MFEVLLVQIERHEVAGLGGGKLRLQRCKPH
jgi:hypothetical protein